MTPELSQNSRQAWTRFLRNDNNMGHSQRILVNNRLEDHINACMAAAEETVDRIRRDLAGFYPLRILEIGSSTGVNCQALHTAYPDAVVVGIEPEKEAVETARSMRSTNKKGPVFIRGKGEQLPFADKSVDLIVCHTVLEHVQSVEAVIRECSRVLTSRGMAHLDAPNYVWPFEPHLRIWTLPLLGKFFVKICAISQGKIRQKDFLDHLNFITPLQLTRLFRANHLVWHNRVREKLDHAINNRADVKRYKRLSGMLSALGRVGIARYLAVAVIRIGLYPSVMYTLRKKAVGPGPVS